jgi:transcriptional regulator with XRE-family HTH domain
MEVGHLVREARELTNLTQVELARRAGTVQSAVSRIEMDQISPTVRTLAHLIHAAGAELRIVVVTEPYTEQQVEALGGWKKIRERRAKGLEDDGSHGAY